MKINQMPVSPLSWIKGDQSTKQKNSIMTPQEKDPVQSLFSKHQVTPTAKELQAAKDFVGDDKSKLATLEVAIQKGVDITGENLEAMHKALTEPVSENEVGAVPLATQESALDQKIEEILKEHPELKEVLAALKEIDPKLVEAVKHFVQTTTLKPSQLKDMLTKLVQVMKENPDMDMLANPKAFLEKFASSLMDTVTNETDAETGKVIDITKDANLVPNQNISHETVNHDNNNQGIVIEGKEYTREEIDALSDEEFDALMDKAMNQLEASMANLTNVVENMGAVTFMIREEITQSMIDVKNEFQHMKVDVNRLVQQSQTQNNPKVIAATIEKVAEKLENLITKSDFTLYTSMKEEKSLLLMTHDLKQAKTAIANGNVMKAKRTLADVMGKINKMNFTPSKREVIAVINKRFNELAEPQSFKPSTIGKNLMIGQPRARTVVGALRDMGLNHESEVGERLDHPIKREEEHPLRENLKSVLMKLENANTNQQVVKDIAKMMNHLEGQQLLNNIPDDKDKLIHSFAIPYVADGQAKEVQVMINGKKNQFRIDEDNCTLYFAFQLEKYGEVGISLNIKDETVSMTINTDHDDLGKIMLPLAEKMIKSQVDYGFKPGRVSLKPLEKKSESKESPSEEMGVNKRKDGRMDVKI